MYTAFDVTCPICPWDARRWAVSRIGTLLGTSSIARAGTETLRTVVYLTLPLRWSFRIPCYDHLLNTYLSSKKKVPCSGPHQGWGQK